MMSHIAICGATGLVGSEILSTLISLPLVSQVHALTRRELKVKDSKIQTHISDPSEWSANFGIIQPPPQVFFSALGTTRAAAGGLENQRKIDVDLGLEVAKTAKAAGVKTFVLISGNGANSKSSFPYLQMKGELEDSVVALGFEHTIVLRPGLIVGPRPESRVSEGIFQGIAKFMGTLSGDKLKDFWAQDVGVIAKAAVSAGLKSLNGSVPKVWELGQKDIVRLGRTEWKS